MSGASRLDSGESIKALSTYLSHADARFTLRAYTHPMPSSETPTWKAVDEMYRTGSRGPDGPLTAHAIRTRP
ncbi:hypothetical protein ACWCV9_09765 [Streptomyces sp. NPDC001606]